jgi:hypothetical protein
MGKEETMAMATAKIATMGEIMKTIIRPREFLPTFGKR